MAKVVLDAGADVNLAAINGVTPLMAAAYAGQAEMAASAARQGRRRRRPRPAEEERDDLRRRRGPHGDRDPADRQGRRSERRLSQRPHRADVGGGLRQDGDGQGAARRRRAHRTEGQPRQDALDMARGPTTIRRRCGCWRPRCRSPDDGAPGATRRGFSAEARGCPQPAAAAPSAPGVRRGRRGRA